MILAAVALARPPDVGSVDSATHPIRCHWERPADASRCDAVLGYAERAWDAQVDRMGFAAPPGDAGEGGSDALDLYLGVSETGGAGEAYVDCDGGDGTCLDTDQADGLARAPSFVVIDARTDDADLESYVTHEFDHTLQYGTDYAEPFLAVWESTAVSAEVWTLGTADASQVADYQATPWISAVLQDGYFLDDEYGIWSWYEYGAATWMIWMDQRYGDGDGKVAPELWRAMTQEGYAYEPDVLDAWEQISGLPWETEFRDFATWRASLVDGDDIGPWAGAASSIRAEGTIDGPGEYTSEYPLYPMGMAVWEVEGLDDCSGLTFEATSDADARLEVLLLHGEQADTFAKYMLACRPISRIAVVSYGPEGFDADDALEPATFTLKVTEAASEGTGCGCGTGAAPGWMAGLVAVSVVGRRRTRLPTRETGQDFPREKLELRLPSGKSEAGLPT